MTKKILIVDDTKSWQLFEINLIKEIYGDFFEIATASSAREAYSIILKNLDNPFDIILTDLQMESDFEPLIAGEWLIEHIKQIKEYLRIPIVIVSAMHNIEFIAKKYEIEYLSKNILVNNKLVFKFMFEKLMPYLNKI